MVCLGIEGFYSSILFSPNTYISSEKHIFKPGEFTKLNTLHLISND